MSNEEHIREAAAKIRENYQAVRLYRGRMPRQRSVSRQQKEEALNPFEAETDSVAMAVKLFDRDEPIIKRVSAILAEVSQVFNGPKTLPHRDLGVRLVKMDHIGVLDADIRRLNEELIQAAEAMYHEMPVLKERARQRQGRLFKAENYQGWDPRDLFRVGLRFINAEMPAYLTTTGSEMTAAIARREQEERERDFELSCLKKEQELAEEWFGMLDHLQERLSGLGEGGKQKSFAGATVTKVFDAINEAERQREENAIGRGAFQRCVERLKEIVRGTSSRALTAKLRENGEFREVFREGCEEVCNSVFNLAIVKPKRNLLLGQSRRRRREKQEEPKEREQEADN